jgi:membrane protein
MPSAADLALLSLAGAALLLAYDYRRERAGGAHQGDHASALAALEPGRGRRAQRPEEIPRRGWRDILLRVYHEISDDRVLAVSAGVTYFALMAIFPAVAALVSLYGIFADPVNVSSNLEAIAGFVPAGGIEIISEQMTRVTAQNEGALGVGFMLGLVLSLWSANGGMKALVDALNVVYDEREKRGFFRLNAISLAFTVGALVFVLLALGAIVAVPIVLDYLYLGQATEWLVSILRWPLLLVIMCVALALIYRYGPSRTQSQWRWISWGSVAAALLWLAASALFSWYAANFGNYNETYGSLGAAVGFMMWLWISTLAILLGGELNSEMEHQTAQDTTVGPPKPMGMRGATMADTVGPAQP